ncbi:MAG: glycosyltransferase family 4 protein [Candidatus Cloacimonadota bacterium]|nr:glycosyltransferase family 4 protein [Candidatus Cloacimonadota bacterium]
MKNILMISYFAPPYNIPSAVRIGKFAKYLPEFGWNPIILTVKELGYYQKDWRQYEGIKKSQIYRTESLDPIRLLNYFKKEKVQKIHRSKEGLTNKIKRLFPIDAKVGWMPFCYRKGKEILSNKKIDAIYCTTGGIYNHVITSYRLAKKFRKPLIVDIRDLWVDHPFKELTFYNKLLNSYWEKKILKFANKVIVVTPGLKKHYFEKYSFLENKIEVITNGFDIENYEYRNRIDNAAITFTFAGNFYKNLSPKDIFNAISDNITDKIKLQFIGNFRNQFWDLKQRFEERKLQNVEIEVLPRMVKNKLYKYLNSADVLLITLPPGEKYECILTTKLFDYVIHKKPILAFCSLKGDLAEFIQKGNLGFIAEAGNIKDGNKVIRKILELKKNKKLYDIHRDEEFVNQYSRKNLTKKLAEIIS